MDGRPGEELTLLERAQRSVSQAVDALDACIASVAEQLRDRDSYDSKLASHLAYMTEAAIRVLDGVRKLEDHDKRAAAKLSPAERAQLLADYIREAPRELRATLVALLRDLDAEEGVLGLGQAPT